MNYFVTPHALKQLRERAVPDLRAVADDRLAGQLDTVVAAAVEARLVEHVLDRGVPAMLVNIGQFGDLFAFVRPNTRPTPPLAVVSVFTAGHVARVRVENRWTFPLNSLVEKLRGVTVRRG